MRVRRGLRGGSLVCGTILLVFGATAPGSGLRARPEPLAVAPQATPARPAGGQAAATFAAGCFWCVEADFDKVPGVLSTTSGFTGGTLQNPTYEQVSAGGTGHAESVQVTYDPTKVTYEQLLDFYWHHVDPFTGDRQFCDVGSQYRPAIFYGDTDEKRLAEQSKVRLEALFKKKIAVQIVAASRFYRAEDYHQDFYKKNPGRYHEYRLGCGRDRRLEEIWGGAKSR
jgi:peptide-methionine (S)-S-oxide reductase